ncbi:glycosyltransferase [Synechococcus sp. N32]|uniref:glycosyltransferase n=1 Tax=Synechococcus sp. N32 TaxID=2575514 RepID=UPI000E0F164F|nr:glycosyltransferase [Synechococcus sp. N32]
MPIGCLDEITELGILRGWARPYKDGSSRQIEIYANGHLVGECVADHYRADVQQQLKLIPNCGIQFDCGKIELPEQTDKNQELIISAKCKLSKNDLKGTHSFSIASALALREKSGIASVKYLSGKIHIDTLNQDGLISGWSDLQSEEYKNDSAVSVKAFIGEKLIGEGLSNIPREDVASERGISKECGFSFYLNISDYCLQCSLGEADNTQLSLIASRPNGEALLVKCSKRSKAQSNLEEILFKSYAGSNKTDSALNLLRRDNPKSHILKYTHIATELSGINCLLGKPESKLLEECLNIQKSDRYPLSSSHDASCRRIGLFAVLLAELNEVQKKIHLEESPIHKPIDSRSANETNIPKIVSDIKQLMHAAPSQVEARLWESYFCLLAYHAADFYFLNSINKKSCEEILALEAIFNYNKVIFKDNSLSLAITHALDEGAITQTNNHNLIEAEFNNGRFRRVLKETENINFAVTGQSSIQFRLLSILKLSLENPLTIYDQREFIISQITKYFSLNAKTRDMRFAIHLACTKWQSQIDNILSLSVEHLINEIHTSAYQEKILNLIDAFNELYWSLAVPENNCDSSPSKTKRNERFLLVGNENLGQVWEYRVSQKLTQLESIGIQTKYCNYLNLNDWRFTNAFDWADAIIFCRCEANYKTLCAINFAKQIGKKIFADIDDLDFTGDFPAPLSTYGGTISLKLHRSLKNQAIKSSFFLGKCETIITSTKTLKDAASQEFGPNKNIEILPNLPPPALETISNLIPSFRSLKVAKNPRSLLITSGTLAHKGIWNEELAPALASILERYPDTSLTTIGTIEIPPILSKFKERIIQVQYCDYKTYIYHVRKCSILLVPLESHKTTDCKSAIKWMEASLCDLATICSPSKAYMAYATAEENILTASGRSEWEKQISKLLINEDFRSTLSQNAYQYCQEYFNHSVAIDFWMKQIERQEQKKKRKVLFINVYFAPQSIGGATRVAQDQVLDFMSKNPEADVTILCCDKDHNDWTEYQSNEPSFNDSIPFDTYYWHNAKIIRLSLPPNEWSNHFSQEVQDFCERWYKEEKFDIIYCHCCQILTASVLTPAIKQCIPYEITVHDAWWISPFQFLVNDDGNNFDHIDPLAHLNSEIAGDREITNAISRRSELMNILNRSKSVNIVSKIFASLYEDIGVKNIKVTPNKAANMVLPANAELKNTRGEIKHLHKINICFIGGMAAHKGYYILVTAAELLPSGLDIEFTVVDHSLASTADNYQSKWGDYIVNFIAKIDMENMAKFYSSQDMLLAPSIWPESFGLVTREALSAGLFVIASDIGALAEPILEDNSNGIKVEPGSADQLTNAILNAVQYLTSKR